MDLMSTVTIMIWTVEAGLCFVFALFSLIIHYASEKRRRAIFVMEVGAFVMLVSNVVSKLYGGSTSEYAGEIEVISNAVVYLCVYVFICGMNMYLKVFVTDRNGAFPKRLKAVYLFSAIGAVLVIISVASGMIFYIDADNIYRRGPLFLLSYVMPFLAYILIMSVVIEYRKKFLKWVYYSWLGFTLLPLLGAGLQAMFYGLAFFDVSVGVEAVVMFTFSLVDQNFFLRRLAMEDRMTGLPNSYGLTEKIEKKIKDKTIVRYNAFFFDIVRMGVLNKRYGNEMGNVILKRYAEEIQGQMEEDELLGRLGSNYFVALVQKGRTKEFLELLSGVDISIENVMGWDELTVSAVAGVYEIKDSDIDRVSPEQILSEVSLAVNAAKTILKKPYVILTPELQKELGEARLLQEMIPKCMIEKEFIPFYQPKVNSKTNRLVGAEALVRWFHDGKFVSPGKFVPIIEQNDSICKFDFYMLDYVCSDIREWLDQGLNPPVISVNFSRKNLGNRHLARDIYKIVEHHHVPPELVQIEITETVDEYPLSHLKDVVLALQKYGLTAAIDDFGTGSASIRILKDVPFNTIKIDKSFVDSTEEKDIKILGYMIGMAKAIHAGIIAEGVEHREQIEILERLGCTEIQGHYFDGPLPKAEFEERIKKPDYGRRT